MPTFDEIKQVSFTPEQARCHVAALCNRAKVMERKLNDLGSKIEQSVLAGDDEKAKALYDEMQKRRGIIAEMRKEIARFREIFGEVVNG